MFDQSLRSPALTLRPQQAAQTEFAVTLDQQQAETVRMLAARAGVTPQEVVQRMATAAPFRHACAIATASWTTTCPDTGKEIPADMRPSMDSWFDTVLYHIGLLSGDALQAFIEAATPAD